MCGRFGTKGKKYDRHPDELIDGFSHIRIVHRGEGLLPPRYNIGPRSQNTILRTTDQGIEPRPALWWLFPPFAQGNPAAAKFATFNVRRESLEQSKRPFAHAWKHGQRCLIPTTVIYEFEALSRGILRSAAIAGRWYPVLRRSVVDCQDRRWLAAPVPVPSGTAGR